LPWCCPEQRAILEFNDLHIPRSLAQAKRQQLFRFTIDQAFSQVIAACAAVREAEKAHLDHRRDEQGLLRVTQQGFAHSVEAWEGDTLVVALRSRRGRRVFRRKHVYIAQCFETRLLYLIEHLSSRGLDWIDIQMMTPHMERLGGRTIERSEFLQKLSAAQQQKTTLSPCFDRNQTFDKKEYSVRTQMSRNIGIGGIKKAAS